MTPAPRASTEQLLACWKELQAELTRRFETKLAAGEATHVRVILDEFTDEAEAKAKALAGLPVKDRRKQVGWLARTLVRPSGKASSRATGTTSPEEPDTPAEPPKPAHIFKVQHGVAKVQTAPPDQHSPAGYAAIAIWNCDSAGWLRLYDEGGVSMGSMRLTEPDQNPAALALQLLKGWTSARQLTPYANRPLPYPDDSWMA